MSLSVPPAKSVLAGLAVVALAVLVVPAAGHVAPATGDNNRYLKLTPLGDRVRLAYTVFYGEVPGAELRRTLDTSGDGAIDDAESRVLGERLARDIAGALVVTIDGAPRPVTWAQVVIGLGTPRVAAGAFSVDLVAWLCLTTPRGPHAVRLRDHYPIERPGETEVLVEDSPGVTIQATRIGGAVDEVHDYKLVGPSGALDTDGLELQFTAGDKAVVAPDAVCRGPERPIPMAVIIGAGAVVAFVLVGAVALISRLRRRRS